MKDGLLLRPVPERLLTEKVVQKDAGFRGEGGPQGGLSFIGKAAAGRIFRHEGQKGF